MIDPIDAGASRSLTMRRVKQAARQEQSQVAAGAQAQSNPKKNAEPDDQVESSEVNTDLSGKKPADAGTSPGKNLDISA